MQLGKATLSLSPPHACGSSLLCFPHSHQICGLKFWWEHINRNPDFCPLYLYLYLYIIYIHIYIYYLYTYIRGSSKSVPFQSKPKNSAEAMNLSDDHLQKGQHFRVTNLDPKGQAKATGWIVLVSYYPLVNLQKTMENHHFFMGKLAISMAIFNSYVSLPEGIRSKNIYTKVVDTILKSTC